MFRRLGVFAGGCTLEAAEAVAAGADRGADPGLDVLSAVRSLVASSLVRREELPDGEVRLVLLRTIREFALEALAACGEAPATRRAHAAWVLALAEQAAPHVQGAAQALWLRRLETEHDNLRAALRWLADAGEAERGLRVGNALLWFWFNRGHWQEGRAWLERFLEAADDRPRGTRRGRPAIPSRQASCCVSGRGRCSAPGGSPRGRGTTRSPASGTRRVSRRRPARAIARRWGGRGTAWGRSRPSTARTPAATEYRASLALFREAGDRWGTNLVLCWLGSDAGHQGHDRAAGGYYEDALAEARRAGNRIGVARGLLGLGDLAWHAGQYAEARRLLEESLAIRHEVGDRQATALVLMGLGRTCRDLGDLAAARAWLEQGLELTRELEGGSPAPSRRSTSTCSATSRGGSARASGPPRATPAPSSCSASWGTPWGRRSAWSASPRWPWRRRRRRSSAPRGCPPWPPSCRARPPPASSTRRVSCAPSTTAQPVPYAPRSTATPARRRCCARSCAGAGAGDALGGGALSPLRASATLRPPVRDRTRKAPARRAPRGVR